MMTVVVAEHEDDEKDINMKSNSPSSLLDLNTFFHRKKGDGVWADEDVYFSMKIEIEKD